MLANKRTLLAYVRTFLVIIIAAILFLHFLFFGQKKNAYLKVA